MTASRRVARPARARWLEFTAGALFLLAVALAAALVGLGLSLGQFMVDSTSGGVATDVGLAIAVLTFAGVGALLVVRRTGVVIGALCLAIGLGSRRRIQRAVDRRFDRARYDGERIVDAFGRRLRHETDILRVTTSLGGTARSAVAPVSFSIWLRPRGGDR